MTLIFKKYGDYFAVLLLSLVSFSFAYHWQILDPSSINWLMNRIDHSASYLGWLFFRGEPWALPLGKITGYFYPVGTTAALTDSIPLLAFIFKIALGKAGGDFQYFGMWLLLCFLLQGTFARLLVKDISENRLYRILAAGFFAFSPVLLQRRAHLALNAQWLLLASLWLYFRKSEAGSGSPAPAYCLLALLGSLIHPYLTVMVLGIFLARVIKEAGAESKACFLRSAALFLASVLLTIFVWKLTGFFDIAYGRQPASEAPMACSTNLNSFINPSGTSRFFGSLPLFNDFQAEGYAYPGAGMAGLILIALAFALYRRCVTKDDYPMIAVSLLFALFSLGNEVTLGKLSILRLTLPPGLEYIYQTFRAQGRFIWVLYYLIFFYTLKAMASFKKTVLRPEYILAGALLIQLLDISPLFMRLYSNFPVNEWASLDTAGWQQALSRRKKIYLCPPAMLSYRKQYDFRQFAYIAAKNGMAINTGKIARGDTNKIYNYIIEFKRAVESGKIESDAAYIVAEPAPGLFTENLRKHCKELKLDGYTVYTMENR